MRSPWKYPSWLHLPLWDSLWSNLQELRRQSLRRGLIEATLVTVGISLFSTFFVFFFSVGMPSDNLLESLAQIGATLLIAYVLEVSWLVKASRRRPLDERENRLGALLGMGVAALAGVIVALILAGRVGSGHWGAMDQIGFGFVVGPLFMAGIFVAMQPLMTHEWLDDEQPQELGTGSDAAN